MDLSSSDEMTLFTKRKMVEIKKEAKMQAEKEELTFQPSLRRSFSASRSRRSSSPLTPSKTLSQPIGSNKHLPADEELTFQPKINTTTSKSKSSSQPSPLSPRQVSERLHRAKINSNPTAVDQPSFHPTITAKAATIKRSPNVVESLYSEAQILKERMATKKVEAEKEKYQECTFSPKVITSPSRQQKMANSAEERFLKYEEIKKAKMQKVREDLITKESSEITFKPTINQQPMPARQGNVYNRLSSSTEKSKSKAVEDEMNANNTFQPKLVAKSKASPQSSAGVHSRLYTEGVLRMAAAEMLVSKHFVRPLSR